MARFLIEVPHEEGESACLRAVQVFLRSGSHFLTRAEWGCKDGEHKAWIIVEVDSKDEAQNIVPHVYRSKAKVVKLNWFSLEEVDELLGYHTN
ncbi:MAG: hypothetical protein V3W18_14700 [candidate division Zixibacteria bacterium]